MKRIEKNVNFDEKYFKKLVILLLILSLIYFGKTDLFYLYC